MKNLLVYFSSLAKGGVILWCYLLWYLVTVFLHFDASPRLWVNSLGISALIGLALMLSVGGNRNGDWRRNQWQTFRLFMMPFAVSSFASLIKGKNYFLIFPENFAELSLSIAVCLVFVALVVAIKKLVPVSG